MGINIRQKGQQGEREISKMLNDIVDEVRQAYGYPPIPEKDKPFQRNQNQSAVGGSDLSNPFGLEIEVKRQEQLSVNSWWKQCVASAERTGGRPILIYRQNRKAWQVRMTANLQLGDTSYIVAPANVDLDAFRQWFRQFYTDYHL